MALPPPPRSAGGLAAALGLLYPPDLHRLPGRDGRAPCPVRRLLVQIRFIERPFCERLGTPFAVDLGQPLLSPAAIADPPVFERARAVAEYDGTASLLVHRLKYNDRLELARALGGMMARAGAELLAGCRRDRAGAPASLAALVAALQPGDGAGRGGRRRRAACPAIPFLLARVKRTRRQVGLTKAQRQENLQGAFRVPVEAKARLKGKRVLLVDDVLTTGSTANAAARALLRGGAA